MIRRPEQKSVQEEIVRLDEAFEAFFGEKRENKKRVRLKAILIPTKGVKWTREEANAR